MYVSFAHVKKYHGVFKHHLLGLPTEKGLHTWMTISITLWLNGQVYVMIVYLLLKQANKMETIQNFLHMLDYNEIHVGANILKCFTLK